MTFAKVIPLFLLGGAATLASLPQTAAACSACFGKSDSAMAKGMNMGVLSLLVVVVVVLSGFAAFLIYLVRRAARMENTPSDDTLQPSNPLH